MLADSPRGHAVNALRPVTAEDSGRLLRWRNRPEISRFMLTDHTISIEEHAAWFAAALLSEQAHHWIVLHGGEEVGLVSVSEIDRRQGTCSWGFYIVERARGRGVGAFAAYSALNIVFGELGLRKLSAEVLASNSTSLALHERFGFTREGVLRAHIIKSDQAIDVLRMGILSQEWAAVRESHRVALMEKGILDQGP